MAELAGRQEDQRLSLWVRVRLGGESLSELAREHGYADGSGVLRVVQRLEERAKEDRELGRRMKVLRREADSSIGRR